LVEINHSGTAAQRSHGEIYQLREILPQARIFLVRKAFALQARNILRAYKALQTPLSLPANCYFYIRNEEAVRDPG
jgi:hypothetical protein